MPSINKVIIVGHLGKDPEAKVVNERMMCTFSVATTEQWKNKSGEKQEHTDWHNVVVWGKLAEICGEYLQKGSLVYIEGRVRYEKWEKDGETRYGTKIVADEMKMLGGKGGGNGERPSKKKDDPPADEPDGQKDFDDDIPF